MKADKLKARDLYLRRTYGISLKDYEKMLEKQGFACAICKRPQTAFKKSLHVDHDHKTNEIRGLLCYYDNKRFVGRHTKETVLKLVAYLLPNKKIVDAD